MNVDKLNVYIKHYLIADKTKRAIMLTGGWGTGKSYYIQHRLIPYLKDAGYQCITVSLYGISNTKDISKSIYWDVRAPKNSTLSEGDTVHSLVGKTILRSVFSAIGIDLNAAENDIQSIYESIDLSNKLLIFEDVERSKIDILDLLGYVNNLVEHDSVKVLLVTNEDELLNYKPQETVTDDGNGTLVPPVREYTDSTTAYLRIKEKTVNDTILFEPDCPQAIKQIVQSFQHKKLEQFCTDDDLNDINTIFHLHNCYNLRTFTFACQKTADIFDRLPDTCTYDNYKNIFYSIIAFSAHIKSGGFPKWQGTKYLSVELALQTYPLYRFCYDYIRWQEFDDAMVKAAFEEHKRYILYGKNSAKNDVDLVVISEFYLHSEKDVLWALRRVENRLLNAEDIPFYGYGELVARLVQFESLLDYDYTICKGRMVANIRGRRNEIDGELLFLFEFDSSDEANERYRAFKADILESLYAVETPIGNFEYSPEELSSFYQEIVHKRDDISSTRQFISTYNVDKLLEMLLNCNAAQLQDFRGVLFAVYRNSGKGSFVEDDVDTMQQLLMKLLEKQETNELPPDRIVRCQFNYLIGNLKQFISQLL